MIILISVVVFVLVCQTKSHDSNSQGKCKIHTRISIRSVNCNTSYCLNVKLAYFVTIKPLA